MDERIVDGGSEGGNLPEWQRRSPDVAVDVSREKNYNKKRTAPEKRNAHLHDGTQRKSKT